MSVPVKKLEDQLKCSICLDTYTNPKLLQCNHVYCQKCLTELFLRDQQQDLTCPKCRKITPVPTNGVAGLQAAFRENQLLEIVERAVAAPEKAGSVSTSPTPHGNTVGCPEHDGEEVKLYCYTCEKTICFKCIMKDEKHHSHNYHELNKAFKRYQQEITSSLESLDKQLETIKKALLQFDVRHDEISNQQATIQSDIHTTVARLHETLDIRKTELIDQLHRLTQAKFKSLAAQRDQIETTQAQLTRCLHIMRENLNTGNQGEALLMKSTTVRQVKELTTTFQPDMLEPNTSANLNFSVDNTAEIQNFGRLLAMGSPDDSKCTATAKGMEVATVGNKSTSLLDLPVNAAQDSITCELVSEITGVRLGGGVERRGQGKCEVSYCPIIKGKHQLHIKMGDQHITGSPIPVAVTSSVEELGPEIAAIRGVKEPMGVAVNQRGEVVVTEGGRRCVTVFSPSGQKLRFFGKFRSGSWFDSGYLNPDGVAVDQEGNIFVADQIDHCVRKFTSQGETLGEVGFKSHTNWYPYGVAFNTSAGKLYVTVDDHVKILHSDLRPAGRFGKKGRGEGEFQSPQHVACDGSGNVYVADRGNCRIQVFTAEGKFLRMFKVCGEGRDKMHPHGIAVDTNGNVYVTVDYSGPVCVFTSQGQFKTRLDITTCHLHGLAVDNSGVLYVCDQKTNSIRLF